MAGPGKGYVSKSDPRRKEWAGLQGTKAGGSNRKASASSYNPTYDPGSGTVASPSGSGRVSTSPKRSKGSSARRSILSAPEVKSSIERLRNTYTPDTKDPSKGGRTVEEARRQSEGNTRQRESVLDDLAAKQVIDPGLSRIENIARQTAARQNTSLSSDGKTVKKFRGRRMVGTPPVKSVRRAAKGGKLKRDGQRYTTPDVRQAKRQVRKARRQVRRTRAAVQTPRKNLMNAGLDPEQSRVLATVLKTGRKMGATNKEMLSAVQTAIVESNIRNLNYGDRDSLGWRQERQMYYDNPRNVKASSRRYFEETAAEGRGAGMTPGQLAQAAQQSAFPEKYDEVTAEAQALLRAFRSAGSASPKAKRKLNRAESKLDRASGKAARLGLGKAAESEDRYKGPLPDNATVWPVAIRGTMGGGPEDHAMRAFGDWQSDNAVDINVPVGTPVRAIKDGVITRTSGSPPNHSGNPAGWNVYLKDKDGTEYFYAHLEEFSVKPGDKVKAGEVIAKSGAANGVPHLHFATPYEVDPRDALEGATTKGGGSDKPKFVNFSKKGGRGTSQTKWLIPTGGNEVLKFQRPLARALVNLAKASGEPVRVNSGFRSYQEQADLYQAYLNGTGNLAAPPGQSNHNHGAAADVELTDRQRELAPQFGLGFPVAGEDWHIELVGDAASKIDASAGGGGSYTGTTPSGGSSSSAPAGGNQRRQRGPAQSKRRKINILQNLRSRGIQVSSDGVTMTGDPRVSEFELAKERFGIK